MQPKYRSLSDRKMQQLVAAGQEILTSCTLCPRQCRVNRRDGQRGFCRAAGLAEVSHWQVHLGEEPPLAEAGGAGAIFFAHCTLACVFCQNFQISQADGDAPTKNPRELADIMLSLQKQGSQNIDLVSPTPYVPQIIAAVQIARQEGLRIPLVYNSHGYESVGTLQELEQIVDVYLPDVKYGDDRLAQRYSGVNEYTRYAKQALAEMVRQTGSLYLDAQGRAQRGVIVRHLVLPNDQAATSKVLATLNALGASPLGLSLMSQYAPCHNAAAYPQINRPLQPAEYEAAVQQAAQIDFSQCWIQELASNTGYFPDFKRDQVFETRRAEDQT